MTRRLLLSTAFLLAFASVTPACWGGIIVASPYSDVTLRTNAPDFLGGQDEWFIDNVPGAIPVQEFQSNIRQPLGVDIVARSGTEFRIGSNVAAAAVSDQTLLSVAHSDPFLDSNRIDVDFVVRASIDVFVELEPEESVIVHHGQFSYNGVIAPGDSVRLVQVIGTHRVGGGSPLVLGQLNTGSIHPDGFVNRTDAPMEISGILEPAVFPGAEGFQTLSMYARVVIKKNAAHEFSQGSGETWVSIDPFMGSGAPEVDFDSLFNDPVPEPSSFAIFGVFALSLTSIRRRKQKARAGT